MRLYEMTLQRQRSDTVSLHAAFLDKAGGICERLNDTPLTGKRRRRHRQVSRAGMCSRERFHCEISDSISSGCRLPKPRPTISQKVSQEAVTSSNSSALAQEIADSNRALSTGLIPGESNTRSNTLLIRKCGNKRANGRFIQARWRIAM